MSSCGHSCFLLEALGENPIPCLFKFCKFLCLHSLPVSLMVTLSSILCFSFFCTTGHVGSSLTRDQTSVPCVMSRVLTGPPGSPSSFCFRNPSLWPLLSWVFLQLRPSYLSFIWSFVISVSPLDNPEQSPISLLTNCIYKVPFTIWSDIFTILGTRIEQSFLPLDIY